MDAQGEAARPRESDVGCDCEECQRRLESVRATLWWIEGEGLHPELHQLKRDGIHHCRDPGQPEEYW